MQLIISKLYDNNRHKHKIYLQCWRIEYGKGIKVRGVVHENTYVLRKYVNKLQRRNLKHVNKKLPEYFRIKYTAHPYVVFWDN